MTFWGALLLTALIFAAQLVVVMIYKICKEGCEDGWD